MMSSEVVEMSDLLARAESTANVLKLRGETIAVAESSAGGLIAAALLALPGASAYFRGGAVVYTLAAKSAFLRLPEETLTNPRAATEGHALVLARGVQTMLGTTWGIGETGATGPTGNRYGDPPGHACLAVSGPVERTRIVRTNRDDREENMLAFAREALDLLMDSLEARKDP